jgi:pilus assembly protein CpaB
MRAVTIRVNDVDGVAGFVLPGDRVDVALTRQADKVNTNDVVLQNVKVLAIDQIADERTDKPAIARAVTLEVNATDAQKVALASTVGNLSLMLRRAGEARAAATRRVTLGDLSNGMLSAAADEQVAPRFRSVGIRRAGKRDDVSVPIEDADSTIGAAARERAAQ